MVADHLPDHMEPRLDRRPAFPVPAGQQAIRRRDHYTFRFGTGTTAREFVPLLTNSLTLLTIPG